MKHLTWMLRAIFILTLWFGSTAFVMAGDVFELLSVDSKNAETHVLLNGFPVLDTTESLGRSADVCRYLRNGTNTLSIRYQPTDAANTPASFALSLIQKTKIVGAYNSYGFDPALVAGGSIHQGAYDADPRSLVFGPVGNNMVWDFSAADAQIYGYIPTQLNAFALSRDVDSLQIAFSSNDNSKRVVYVLQQVPAGTLAASLSDLTPIEGKEYLGDGGFSRISFTVPDTAPFSMSSVYMQRLKSDEIVKILLPTSDLILDEDVIARGRIRRGEYEDGALFFQGGIGSQVFDFEFADADAIQGVPGKLHISKLSMPVKRMSVTLIVDSVKKGRNAKSVVMYPCLPVETDEFGGAELSLVDAPLILGNPKSVSTISRVIIRVWKWNLSDGAPPLRRFPPRTPKVSLGMEGLMFRHDPNAGIDIERQFNVSIPQTWVWESARPVSLPLAKTDADAIKALLMQVRDALDNRDTASLDALLQLKAKEAAKAMYKDYALVAAQQHDFYVNRVFVAAGWGMSPLDTDDVTFSLAANGRAVVVGHRNWPQALRSEEITVNGRITRFSLPIVVTKVRGKNGSYEWKVIQ